MVADLPYLPSPAKAGAQYRAGQLAGAPLNHLHLSNWAPAFAGEGKN
jgi:hypothetical protein